MSFKGGGSRCYKRSESSKSGCRNAIKTDEKLHGLVSILCILCIVCFVSRFCFVDCSLLLGNVAEPTRRMVGQRQQKLAMTSTNHFVWQVCRSQLRFNTEQATRSLQKVLGTLLMTLCFDSIFKYKLFFPRMPTQEFKSYLLYDFLCSTTVGYIGTILNFQDGFF